MSSRIEDRLTAALEARAELVAPEDLRPLEVPGAARRPARTAGALLLAAAVTAAVVATPFVLTHDGGTSPAPGPAGTPTVVPSPSGSAPTPSGSRTPSSPSQVTAGLTVAGRQRADVDGDGRPDRVRLLTDATSPDEPGERGALEVTLATGETGAAEVPGGYVDLRPAFDIDRDGREQVLLSHTEGGDAAQLLVYAWVDGALVQARKEGDAPLVLELAGDGAMAAYHTGDQGLLSWRRLRQVSGSTYRVEQWSWTLDGDRLVPNPAGEACVDVTTEAAPGPC